MREQENYEHGAGEYHEEPYTEVPDEIDDRHDDVIDETDSLEEHWLKRARTVYSHSTDYLTNSLRYSWERNWRLFRNEHPSDSKYGKPAYKNRSRTFRPKLRSASTQRLAALSLAMHSNNDLLDVTARNALSNEARASADVLKQLVQYRMDHNLNWLSLSLGAFQSCDIYNICVSRQDWDYRVLDTSTYEPAFDEETGEPMIDDDGIPLGVKNEGTKVVADEPRVVLIKPENFRFDPNADWTNPIKDSPYLIEDMPMFAGDVASHMEMVMPHTGEETWRKLTLAQIISAGRADETDTETVRLAREGDNRRDPVDAPTMREDTLVWVRRYIIREGHEDWTFYTLGDTYLLTTPVRFEETSRIGRNYVCGVNSLEVFRNYPSSAMDLGSDLAMEINDVANQRLDNVKLVLNKRYFIKRQKQGSLDLQALMNNVPGGGVMLDDPLTDVKVLDTPDITKSSYEENDRLSIELDEVLGNFSNASVHNNQNMTGQVGIGGMDMMSQSATALQELSFKLFVNTWVEPVLQQLVQLESAYETDEVVLALAGAKSEIFIKYGIDRITDSLLSQDLMVKVNVGMGHTNPMQKLQKLSAGVDTMLKMPGGAERANFDEINNEVWSHLGFVDGTRFTIPQDQVQKPDPMSDPDIQVKMAENQRRAKADDALVQHRINEGQSKERIELERMASNERIKMAQIEAGVEADGTKNQTVRDMAAVRETNKSREISIKDRAG